MTSYVYAMETGLSSDPLMNRRVSVLDDYRLISNSDAHSPGNLGREATLLMWNFLTEALQRRFGRETVCAERLNFSLRKESIIWMDIENAEFVLLLRRRKHMEEYVLYAGAR